MTDQDLNTALESSLTNESQPKSDCIWGVFEVTVISVPDERKPTFTVTSDGQTRAELHRQIQGLVFQKYGSQPEGAKHSWSAVLLGTDTSL